MPSLYHRPSYQDFSLRTQDGSWLHESRWEPEHFAFFVKARVLNSKTAHSLLSAPKMKRPRDKKKNHVSFDGRWVYKDVKDQGWAELQRFERGYYKVGFIFYSFENETMGYEAIASLISFIFMVGGFDHLRIIDLSPRPEILRSMEALMGESREIMSFRPLLQSYGSGLKLCVNTATLNVSRLDWMKRPEFNSKSKDLKVVQARLERVESRERSGPKRKRRSFFARLFRPKIDDSLL